MTLKSVYEDPSTSTRDPALLAKRAGTTVKSARAFLRDQASSQVAQLWRKPAASSGVYAPTGAPRGHWQADVIYIEDYQGVNARRKAMLSVLNTTTRYAVVRPLLSAKAEKTADAMRSVLEELTRSVRERKPIKVLRVDGGGEFKGSFAALMREQGIELEVGEPNTHYRLARTDRFHKTLRQRIGEHFERADTHRWLDVLPDIVANYNSTPHRTLTELLGRPTAPAQVSAAQERVIRQAESVQASEVRARVDRLGFVPGQTQVRLLISRTREGGREKHAKSHRRVWTSEIYTVLSRSGPNSFIVDVPAGEVSVWPFYALMVVGKALKSGTHRRQVTKKGEAGANVPLPLRQLQATVDVKVERAKRLEARNIPEEEQKANLAAPARPRRERAKKVDYAAMAAGKGIVMIHSPVASRKQSSAR